MGCPGPGGVDHKGRLDDHFLTPFGADDHEVLFQDAPCHSGLQGADAAVALKVVKKNLHEAVTVQDGRVR